MVKFWEVQLKQSIAKKKLRIKHFEKHGLGLVAIKAKADLVKAERQLELRKK